MGNVHIIACSRPSLCLTPLLRLVTSKKKNSVFIPTGRKPALNSEVHLTARCAEIEIAVSKYTCTRVVSTCSIKGHGQMLARAIVHVIACHPAQKGAYFLKSMRIEHRQRSKFVYALIILCKCT